MADGSDKATGWLGIYPDDLRFFSEVPSPRPGSYWRQLRYNLHCFWPWTLLAPSAAALAIGLWQGWWALVGGGAVWLAGYFFLSWTAAAILRDGRLRRGVLWAQPGPATEVEAVLPDGESIRAALPARSTAHMIDHLIERHGRAEVLLLCHPTGRPSLVVGARAPTDPPGGGATAEPVRAPDRGVE
jgi:hypothetical protein